MEFAIILILGGLFLAFSAISIDGRTNKDRLAYGWSLRGLKKELTANFLLIFYIFFITLKNTLTISSWDEEEGEEEEEGEQLQLLQHLGQQ